MELRSNPEITTRNERHFVCVSVEAFRSWSISVVSVDIQSNFSSGSSQNIYKAIINRGGEKKMIQFKRKACKCWQSEY